MTGGFVGAPSLPNGIQWFSGFATALMFGMKGDAIGHNDGMTMAWLAATRCTRCRLIVARY
jgi:hypothetical protein